MPDNNPSSAQPNDSVVIAVLGGKLDGLIQKVEEFCVQSLSFNARIEERVRRLEIEQAKLETTMNVRVGIGSAIAAALAALFAYLKS
jgi:hypothetical protein